MKKLLKKIVDVIDSIRLERLSRTLINLMSRQNYAHGLTWFGSSIFQTPTDLFLYQQLIFKSQPTVIVETGVAKGGSVLFACQMLDLLHGAHRRDNWCVICCDINSTNEAELLIEKNGYLKNVQFFNGDSSSSSFSQLVADSIQLQQMPVVLLSLDSNHTEDHVHSELISLSKYVTSNSYAIVWDSRLGDLSRLTHYFRPRSWNKTNHAGTGAELFLSGPFGKQFTLENIDEKKLLLSGTKNGVLRKI